MCLIQVVTDSWDDSATNTVSLHVGIPPLVIGTPRASWVWRQPSQAYIYWSVTPQDPTNHTHTVHFCGTSDHSQTCVENNGVVIVTLTGLTAGTPYSYWVESNDTSTQQHAQAGDDNSGYTLTTPAANLMTSEWPLLLSSHYGNSVLRYDAATGQFVDAFVPSNSDGLYSARGIAIGPNGDFYVVSSFNNRVLEYDLDTGAYVGSFSPFVNNLCGMVNWTGGETPTPMRVGPDGALYLGGVWTDRIARYDVVTQALNDSFIYDPDHLVRPIGFAFGPDGNLYVMNSEPTPG